MLTRVLQRTGTCRPALIQMDMQEIGSIDREKAEKKAQEMLLIHI